VKNIPLLEKKYTSFREKKMTDFFYGPTSHKDDLLQSKKKHN
jgi:hypothetical protein